jgi:ATP-dependent DNA helicase RecQ
VRFIIDYALPESVEAYYAHVNGAGTDGLPARCVLLHDPDAARAADVFVAGHAPALPVAWAVYSALEQLGAATHTVARMELVAALDALTRDEMRDAIAMLKALALVGERRGLKLRLLKTGLDADTLGSLLERHAAADGATRRARDEMLAYAETRRCRWKALTEHFGEPVTWERCGTCDNCRTRPDGETAPHPDTIDSPDRPAPHL